MAEQPNFTENMNLGGEGFSKFQNSQVVSGSKDFLMSNTLIAKIAFLLLVIIGFFIVFRMATQLIMWIYSPSPEPYLITCRRDGKETKNIPVDPSIKNSVPILRSINEKEGIEFTWSIWLFIDKPHEAPNSGTKYYHIFSKGTKGILSREKNFDAAPGLYIKSIKTDNGNNNNLENSLVAVMNTYKGLGDGGGLIDENVVIKNIPIRKWFHVALRLENKNFDSYVNGILHTRKVLKSLPRQNYGDVHVSEKGKIIGGTSTTTEYGFSGELSSLRYFNSALNPVEISNIVKVGPNMCTDESAQEYPPYFSDNWYDIR